MEKNSKVEIKRSVAMWRAASAVTRCALRTGNPQQGCPDSSSHCHDLDHEACNQHSNRGHNPQCTAPCRSGDTGHTRLSFAELARGKEHQSVKELVKISAYAGPKTVVFRRFSSKSLCAPGGASSSNSSGSNHECRVATILNSGKKF